MENVLEAQTTTPDDAVLRTLLLADLVSSTKIVEQLGDARAFEIATRHDRIARDLLRPHHGIEIDKSDGFLLLFEHPLDAASYALAYHEALAEISTEMGVQLRARVGIHLGEVYLRENDPDDIARGAKPIEVEGLAKPMAARVMSLAGGKQTLMTAGAFNMARQRVAGSELAQRRLSWLAHGPYVFQGVSEPVDIYEVGISEVSLLEVPPDSEKVHRMVTAGHETTLGWRAAPGLEIPRRTGWVLSEQLGVGGFGEVWLATQASTSRQRVFKFCYDAERLHYFQREVTLFRLLRESLGSRPEVARIFDWNFEQAPFFLEMEYVDGGDLSVWAEQEGGISQVPIETRLEIVAQIADALAAAHSVGILHKDVKPQNVLIVKDRSRKPWVKLADFGISEVIDRKGLIASGITVLGMTELAPLGGNTLGGISPGSVPAGTHFYMAPEVTEGRLASVEVDIYALGVILYQMIAGDFRRALGTGWRRDVEDELLADEIEALVDRDPSRRPASAREVAERLRTLEERRHERERALRNLREAEATRQALEVSQKRRKMLSLLAAVAVLVLAVVSLLAMQAISARNDAEKAREVADSRRVQAEELIDFMLGDLQNKLEPIGRLDILSGIGDQAKEYFASVSQEELSSDELFHHSDALFQIGVVRSNEGNLEAADEAFHEALTLSRAAALRNPENVEWQIRLGKLYFNIGRIFWLKSDLEEALVQFQAQFEITQRLAEKYPDDSDIQNEFANARNNIGYVHQGRGDLQSAAEAFRFVLEVKQTLLQRQPENTDLQYAYTNQAVTVGKVLWELGEVHAAREHFDKSQEVALALVVQDADNTFWQELLGITHNFLGRTARATGNSQEAQHHFRENLRIFLALTQIESQQTTWQQELAFAYRHVGYSLLGEGQAEKALQHAEEGVAILARLADKTPTVRLQRELATSHTSVGEILLAQGKRSDARNRASTALALLEPIAQEKPSDLLIHRRLAEALVLQGRIEGPPASDASWQRAARVMEPFVQGSSNYDTLDLWRQILGLLQRGEEAAEGRYRLPTSHQ